MKIHFSGYATAHPQVAAGCACRPDGQYARTLICSSDASRVTCAHCKAVL